jgi:hypothetical protein
MMKNKKIWILLILLFLFIGAISGYFFLYSFDQNEKVLSDESAELKPEGFEDLYTLRIFYPIFTRLHMTEKKLPRRTKQIAIAEAVIEEYFKGFGNGKISHLPRNVKLLGLYRGLDDILYIDLSDALRTNFQGDALSEYLLLKGLYESLISNLRDFDNFKILVEGRELETLGGHFFLKYTLKDLLS